MKDCGCVPEIDYKCQEHRPFGCFKCGEQDESKLFFTAMGIYCKKCRSEFQTFW